MKNTLFVLALSLIFFVSNAQISTLLPGQILAMIIRWPMGRKYILRHRLKEPISLC